MRRAISRLEDPRVDSIRGEVLSEVLDVVLEPVDGLLRFSLPAGQEANVHPPLLEGLDAADVDQVDRGDHLDGVTHLFLADASDDEIGLECGQLLHRGAISDDGNVGGRGAVVGGRGAPGTASMLGDGHIFLVCVEADQWERQAEAEEAIHRFEHNVEHLAEDLPADAVDTRVAVGFGDTNWMIWDSSSFCKFLHDEGAGTCVFPAQPESEYGSPDSEFAWEFIVEADPEVWVMITWEGSARADSVTEPVWLETTAHQQGRICNEDSAGSFGHGLLMLQWAYQCYLNAGWPSIYDHPGDLSVWLPEDH